MKRAAVIPAVLVFAFFPVFALQAEKLSAPLPKPKVIASANSEFVSSVAKLRSTLVTVRYPEVSEKKYSLRGDCATFSKPVWSSLSSDGIRTEIVPAAISENCPAQSVRIRVEESGKEVPGSSFSIPVTRYEPLFLTLSDLSDAALFLYARDASVSAKALAEESKALIASVSATPKDKLEGLSKSYRAAVLEYRSSVARELLGKRESLKYVLPVPWAKMSTEHTDIPWSGRPYRKSTTDGVHHGWDLMAKIWTPVVAVGDGVVTRVVNGFAWKDFENLVRSRSLTSDQELLNLDVYRGNQIWLKTADGNVTFYSHLSQIAPDVAEGKYVRAGEILGNVGITGVPDRNFGRPHLHFEIQVNPRDGSDSQTPLSVMRWPWLGKGMGREKAVELTNTMFKGP